MTEFMAEHKDWMVGAVTILVVSGVIRMVPKQKIVDWLQPKCIFAGEWISKILLRWLPPRAAEKVEEGIIVTVLYIGRMALKFIETGLLEDNKSRVDSPKKIRAKKAADEGGF